MKIILTLLFCFCSSLSFSQIIQNLEQRETILDLQKKEIYEGKIGLTETYPIKNYYAIVTEHRDIRSQVVNIFFDFGQASGYFDIDYIIDDNGNKFQLYSVVDAMNYMKKLGWHFVESSEHVWPNLHLTKYLFENTGNAIVPILLKK